MARPGGSASREDVVGLWPVAQPGTASDPAPHTDCGIRRLANYPEQLAAFFEIPVAELASKAVEDPYASVRIDVDIARHKLPPDLLVSGLVYDVDTGLIDVVVPATTEQRHV
jgi:carbonic anhydrase